MTQKRTGPATRDDAQDLRGPFRLAVDTIPGMVWTCLPDGQRDFLNQRWLDYTGLTLDEAKGWGWAVAIHPDDVTGMLETLRDILASGAPGESEFRLRRFDGVYRWCMFRVVPLHDPEGRLVKWYGLSTDIEDRKDAEALLTAERRLLEMVARGCPLTGFLETVCRSFETLAGDTLCSILLVDRNGACVEVNVAPSMARSYSDALKGWPIRADAGPCGMATVTREQVICSDVASDARFERSGWRGLALAHGLKACWSTPILSQAGQVLGTFAIYFRKPGEADSHHRRLIDQFTQIASIAIERVRSEETLHSVRAELSHVARLATLGELTASIAHEVNQPLAGIVTNASTCLRLLDVEPLDLEGIRDTARRTLRDGNRAAEVIARLRALFAKRDAASELVNLNEAIQEVVALTRDEARKHRVVLTTEMAEPLPSVVGDRVQLQQVAMNLILNAVEAMSDVEDRARRAIVRTRTDGPGRVRIEVEDSGAGIDPGALERIFEPFYTSKHGGMGMGLSIARTIVESHGGQLSASSTAGRGATFVVRLAARGE